MQDKGIGSNENLEKRIENSPEVKVPPRKRATIGIIVAFFMASIFFLLFGYGISQIYGLVLTYTTIAFSLLGFDPVITALIMALIFLFLGSVFLLIARRGSSAASKIEAGLRLMIDETPVDYYDLSEVPYESLVREFVGNNTDKKNGRGCKLSIKNDSKGFDISCDQLPVTRTMKLLSSGDIDSLDWKQRGIVIGIFSLLGAIFTVITYMHLLAGFYLYIVWGIYIFSLFFVMIEIGILKLWGISVGWGLIIIAFLFMPVDPFFFWTVLGAWICYTIAIAIVYLLFKHQCVSKWTWICEMM